MRYDAVVVGAGPAGASCASALAQEGAKVLLLEKRRLPRFKLCGGCISARTVSLLPEGWESEVLNEIKGGILGFRGKEFVERTARRAVAYIIDRNSFDHFLVKDALNKGAELWEETEFLGFEEGKGIIIETSRGRVEADFLIGADGFYTKVGRSLGYRKEKFFRSVELFTEGELRDRVVIDIGVVKRGYAWIFPKGEKMAIGLATTGKENLLETLRSYLSSHRLFSGVRFSTPKGWMIPFITREKDAQLGRGKVLLVGDAASLVDPLLGEGLCYALLSAELVARSNTQPRPASPLTSYRKLLMREVIPELVARRQDSEH
ncbi:MAG: geranylgeranyl reductase family protein [Aquificota bacterium]|nr:geranylgeranyl reductase family protein [Aquificota bacterium]